MKSPDILQLLQRTDKHFLGGGNRVLWAPPFPQFLDRPGFWDKAQYFNLEFQPVYTWTLLDEQGREISLTFQERKWDPSSLHQTYSGRVGPVVVNVEEEKAVLEDDVVICQVSVRVQSRKKMTLHLVAWTAQEQHPVQGTTWLENVVYDDGLIRFTKHVKPPERPEFSWETIFALTSTIHSYAINLSEPTVLQPLWRVTPFFESFTGGRLPGVASLEGISNDGLIFLGLHTEIAVGENRPQTAVIALAAAPSQAQAQSNIWPVLQADDPLAATRIRWRHFFRTMPYFECSDEYLTHYYWYRWYGLRLNTISVSEGNYQYPFVSEGIGYFHAPISYSAMCHMFENRWMHDPALAQGSLLTFIHNQRDDGAFRGYIDPHYYRQEMFYHADWGHALLEVYAAHPSVEFLDQAYEGLSRYARYFDRERDEEVSGLYDIDNHYETGQEYMHRYIAVNPAADRDNWGEVFRVKGVDATVYLYRLKRALAVAARLLGRDAEAARWSLEADRTRDAVRTLMWDPVEQMFFDVNPATGNRTGVKAATCFYPYFTDIVEERHLPGLKQHLLDRREFWTPFPVPSSSADDSFFSALPLWKGKRMNCPWNGRVWPMTNSHIAEALAVSAQRFGDTQLRRTAVKFIQSFIRMMFFDGDSSRPNCFEHYNPFNGLPSIYRGVDDYQHSWVVDLILKYVCGIRPDPDGTVLIDPLPFGLEYTTVTDVRLRGRRLDVTIENRDVRVSVDGREFRRSKVGRPVVVHL